MDDQTIASEIVLAEINISTASISLIYIFVEDAKGNSLGSINMLIIPYDARVLYINVVLKEYPYLFLYNSGKFQNKYVFKNLSMYLKCEKKHNKEKVISWLIDDSYNIKCLFSLHEKEIKVNALPENFSEEKLPDVNISTVSKDTLSVKF